MWLSRIADPARSSNKKPTFAADGPAVSGAVLHVFCPPVLAHYSEATVAIGNRQLVLNACGSSCAQVSGLIEPSTHPCVGARQCGTAE